MEHKIIKEKKNPFLSRVEYEIEVDTDITPNESEVKEMLGKNPDLTVVKKILGQFGKQVFIIEAVVYDSLENKEKIEVIPKKVRKKMEKDKKDALEAARKAEEAAKKKAEEEAKAAQTEENKEGKTE